MNEVLVDIELQESVPPHKFIEELYALVAEKFNRVDGVYPDDFFYEAIPIDGEEKVWWLSAKHPLALMLKENEIRSIGRHYGPLGEIEIYSDANMRMCRDTIVAMCIKYNLKIHGRSGEI